MKSKDTFQKLSAHSKTSITSASGSRQKGSRGFVYDDGEWWYRSEGHFARARIAKCETCEKQFVDYPNGETKFCSKKCRRVNCARCGKRFRPESARHKFCSWECKQGTNTCEHCGKQFVPQKNIANRFCSKACFYDYTCPFGTIRPNHSGGYLIIKVGEDVPGAKVHYGPNKKGWMLAHRYVMQQKLGRPLLKTERVHHINADRKDNRPENLELWKRTHPAGVRSGYHCPGCRCFDADFQCEETTESG